MNKNRDRETIRRKNTISDDYDRIQQEEMTNHELFYREIWIGAQQKEEKKNVMNSWKKREESGEC